MGRKWIFSLALVGLSLEGWAGVSLGGYVPFGLNTQKKSDGTQNILGLEPTISINHKIPFNTPISQSFLPELGLVLHLLNKNDDYSKKTIYLLLDWGYSLSSQFMLRYGTGYFITRIEGKVGDIRLNNGNGTDIFYRPSRTISSWNTTLNLGVEMLESFNLNPRLEIFLFSPLNKVARQVSYLLSVNYDW